MEKLVHWTLIVYCGVITYLTRFSMIFLLKKDIKLEIDFGGAKCPKFNIVGPEEINNLELAQLIADSQGKAHSFCSHLMVGRVL